MGRTASKLAKYMGVNMKKVLRLRQWSILGLLFIFFAVTAAGCSNGDDKKDSSDDKKKGVIYPISINGTEIRVGETTVQTLLDKGFKVTVSEMTSDNKINQYEVDPEAELEANTYYSGGSVWITDKTFAHVSMITGEESVKMGEAVIARIEVSVSHDELKSLKNILFNGVPITEISREKAGEMFPDFSGDDNMWFSPATMTDYKYFMSFSAEEKILNNFYTEKKYDVDWSSKK